MDNIESAAGAEKDLQLESMVFVLQDIFCQESMTTERFTIERFQSNS